MRWKKKLKYRVLEQGDKDVKGGITRIATQDWIYRSGPGW
jgi:hypothetical protein